MSDQRSGVRYPLTLADLRLRIMGDRLRRSSITPTDKGLDAFLEFTTWQQHAVPACSAHHPDIGPQPDDLPLVATAWMRLAQAHQIAHSNFQNHGAHYSIEEQVDK